MRVDNQIISLDPLIVQFSPNGREFRVIGIKMNLSHEPKWMNGTEKFCWIVTIKFLDDSQLVEFYFNNKDECVKKETIMPFVLESDFKTE